MRRLLPTFALTLLAACSASTDEDTSDDAVSDEVKVFWADATDLNLSDLSGVPGKLATDQFNTLFDEATGARIDETKVYAAAAEPNRLLPDSVEVHGLDTIVPLLERDLGQPELGTKLNALRLAQLRSGAAKYYVESGFALKLGVDHDWSFKTPGLADGAASVGLTAGTAVETRVLIASDDAHVEAAVRAPLAAAKALRGFVAPRSIDDVRRMLPGEAFALRGSGKLATNLGLGVPVFAAGGPLLNYQIAVSAGIAAAIEGRVDVQLIRLDGDEVIVDVGVDRIKSLKLHAAVEDGFGIKARCKVDGEDNGEDGKGKPCLRDVNLGGQAVNLARFVERGVERHLTNHFQSRASVSYEKENERVGLTRIHFHLDRGDRAQVATALTHALKFDLRLAEAMANRDLGQANAAVTVDFDAVRKASSSTLDFGFKLAGIDIYDRTVAKKTGTFVLQTPEGATVLSFDTLQKSRKLFQTDHGYTRVGVGALSITPKGSSSATNLFVRTQFGDTHVHDDRFTDGLDAVLRGIGGAAAVASLDAAGGELERTVSSRCAPAINEAGQAGNPDDECNVALLADPSIKALRDRGNQALSSSVSALPASLKALVLAAGNMRLGLQSTYISPGAASVDGVGLSLTVDQRFDEGALDELTRRPGAEYRKALVDYLAALVVERGRIGEGGITREAAIARVESKYQERISRMERAFVEGTAGYRKLADAETRIIDRLAGKRFVATPVGLRLATDRAAAGDYEGALLASPAHERSKAIAAFYDALVKAADKSDADVRLYKEQAAALPLLSLVSPKRLKVGLTVELSNVQDEKNATRDRFRKALAPIDVTGAGAEASSISLGDWDLDAVLGNRAKEKTE